MAKTNINDSIRNHFMELIGKYLVEQGEEVLQVKTGTYSIPWAKDEEEGYLNITFSIPKGERGGSGYDGHSEAENFILEQRVKAEKKAEAEAKKKAKAEKDAAARKAKAEAKAAREES